MDDEDSLRKALQGAYAVFSVTNFGAHMNPERETRQGVNVANAAAVTRSHSKERENIDH